MHSLVTPTQSLVEKIEANLNLLFRSQVDANDLTGEQYPNVKLIDFEHPLRNQFHGINNRVSPFEASFGKVESDQACGSGN